MTPQADENITAIVDYGLGNLRSLSNALEATGHRVCISSDKDVLLGASRVVLPGVGSFSEGSQRLRDLGLLGPIGELVQRKTPLLGICLGMQLLFTESDEHGKSLGLGLLPGRVEKIADHVRPGARRTHVGWRSLIFQSSESRKHPIVPISGDLYYFVHSYAAFHSNAEHLVASVKYDNSNLAAVVCSESVLGVQFHPEKSGSAGLRILENFGRLSG